MNRPNVLFLLIVALIGWNASFAQDFDYTDEDLPEFIEDFGYEDVDYSGPDLGPSADRVGSNGQAMSTGQCRRSCDCFWCRDTLFGDRHGYRACLQQHGILYRGRLTQFAMGVGGGVNDPIAAPLPDKFSAGDRFDYTGTSRHDFLLNLERLVGGLPESRLAITVENIWGRFGNVSFSSGGVAPVFGAFMPFDPESEGVPRVTNFMYLQPVSEELILGVGKLRLPNTADRNIFAGGDGTDQFVNQAFAANPLFMAIFPISTFAVTAVSPQEWGNAALSVIDTKERSLGFFDLGNLFSEGVTVMGQVQVNTNFFCKPGEHHIGGIWKHSDLDDLSFTPQPPDYPYPPAAPGNPFVEDTYVLYYGFDQYVRVYGKPNRRGEPPGWGIFGRAGLADGATGNPNFYGWTASLGVGGDTPLRSRRGSGDRFGLGYAYTATSTEWGPVPTALFGPRDYQVFEAYYRYQLTPAISVTPDVQWAKGLFGALTQGDDAFIYGFRLNMVL